MHVLTLTPFYPSDRDDQWLFRFAEPLDALADLGVRNTVFALQPLYRAELQTRKSSVRAEWVRYFSLPGNFGLPVAGAFAFARIVGRVRELQRTSRSI